MRFLSNDRNKKQQSTAWWKENISKFAYRLCVKKINFINEVFQKKNREIR